MVCIAFICLQCSAKLHETDPGQREPPTSQSYAGGARSLEEGFSIDIILLIQKHRVLLRDKPDYKRSTLIMKIRKVLKSGEMCCLEVALLELSAMFHLKNLHTKSC